MNVFAGEKLYGRKPMHPPATATRAMQTGIEPILAPCMYAMYARQSDMMATDPAARPSRPSIRLTALVIPTIHSTVMIYPTPALSMTFALLPVACMPK